MKRLFLIFSALTMVACGPTERRIWEDSFVLTYAPAHPQMNVQYDNNLQNPLLNVNVWGGGTNPIPDFAKSCSYQNNKSLYKQLCNKHNDNGYKEERYEYTNLGLKYDGFYTAVSADFAAIDITTSPAYDDAHTDGGSIADLVKVTYSSLKPFIDAGYKRTEGATYRAQYGNYSWVSKMMNEMSIVDMTLLGPTMTLEFVTPPATSRIYTTVLTMTSDEGDIYRDTLNLQIPLQ